MTKQTIIITRGADGKDGKAYGKGAVAGKGGKGGKGGNIYYSGGDGGDATVIGKGYARGGDGGDVIGEVPERDMWIARFARRVAVVCFVLTAIQVCFLVWRLM